MIVHDSSHLPRSPENHLKRTHEMIHFPISSTFLSPLLFPLIASFLVSLLVDILLRYSLFPIHVSSTINYHYPPPSSSPITSRSSYAIPNPFHTASSDRPPPRHCSVWIESACHVGGGPVKCQTRSSPHSSRHHASFSRSRSSAAGLRVR